MTVKKKVDKMLSHFVTPPFYFSCELPALALSKSGQRVDVDTSSQHKAPLYMIYNILF